MDKIRSMADDGMSQGQIATRLGCTQNNISRWCMKAGIVTNAAAKQKQHVTHGFGAAPDRLMPSADALRAVSIWSVAGGFGHGSTLNPVQSVGHSVESFTF